MSWRALSLSTAKAALTIGIISFWDPVELRYEVTTSLLCAGIGFPAISHVAGAMAERDGTGYPRAEAEYMSG
jgi:hypothetical protein